VKKISHTKLEACRFSPKAWALSQVSGGGFATFGYKQALANAINVLHRVESFQAASEKLEDFIDRHFTNPKKIAQVRDQLIEYAAWYSKAGIVIADSNVTINYPSQGMWHLGGIVARVDVTDLGYRAILFEAFDNNWKNQLRMPLIQLAIAEQYGRPPGEVYVGFQDLDGNSAVEGKFGDVKRKAAIAEFLSIGNIVQEILPPT